ncbi:CsbD family protein [Methylobacterium sp. D53M]|jgi:uncharacterized protein YjbJ (UPF0337 family)
MVDTDRIVGGAKEAVGKVQGAAGDFASSNRDSVEGRFREAQGQAQNVYGQVKDKARDIADRAGDYASDAYERAGDVAEDVYQRGGSYLRDGRSAVGARVEENPLVALLIAGAVGYGLALLVHGRR